MPRGIYRFNAKGINRLSTIKYTGVELLTIMSVLLCVMVNIMDDDELLLIWYFLLFLLLVRDGGESNTDLVSHLIFKFKSHWVSVFDPNEYSYRFPNFDSADAWPELLKYLGPAFLYSTEGWEILHKYLRGLKFGNNKNTDQDTLLRHSQQAFLNWTNSFLIKRHVHPKEDKSFIGSLTNRKLAPKHVARLNRRYEKLLHISSNITTFTNQILWAEKIFVSNSVLQPGTFIYIGNQETNQTWHGQFQGAFIHNFLGKDYKWLWVYHFRDLEELYSCGFTIAKVSSKKQDFIPLTDKITVNKAHVFEDGEICLFNHWVQRTRIIDSQVSPHQDFA